MKLRLPSRLRLPLHLHIAMMALALIIVGGGAIGTFAFTAARALLEEKSLALTERSVGETLAEIERIVAPADMAVAALTFDAIGTATTLAQRRQRLPLLREMLDNAPAVAALHIGYDNGDFFMLRPLRDAATRAAFNAPDGAAWLLQTIERKANRGRFIHLDAALTTLREDDRPDYPASFDPRQRHWFDAALAAPDARIITPAYRYFTTQQIGATIARRMPQGNAVAAADLLLETVDASLARQKATPASHVMLVNARGFIVAADRHVAPATIATDSTAHLVHLKETGAPVLDAVAQELERLATPQDRALHVELPAGNWRVRLIPLPVAGAPPFYLVTASPEAELFAAAFDLRRMTLLITALVLLLSLPAAWALARMVARPLRALAGEAAAIARLELATPERAPTAVAEVAALAAIMDDMRRTIGRFLDVTHAVAAEEDFDTLLPMLLTETMAAAKVDAGVLYLADPDGLVPVAATRADGSNFLGCLLPLPLSSAGPLLAGALQNGSARTAALTAADLTHADLAVIVAGAAIDHGLAVPLMNREHQPVGLLLLLHHAPIEAARQGFVTKLAGYAATTLTARELIKAQRELFDALIKLLANAIDTRSHHTGGHCTRVPIIVGMLARAAAEQTSGLFADFHLDDKGREVLHMAAWLHDCGKITTPDHVVDKATRLEAVHDRIHEVRMRFEVLKRDARIVCLEAILAGEDAAAAHARLTAELNALDDDFAFVARCNNGDDAMTAERRERLQRIAARTWLRTLDDRLGISHEEAARKAHASPVAPPLPVSEPLLADRPEHAIARRADDRLGEDPTQGFCMEVPALLYNHGELHNLTSGRGTLTAEERYKINEHIVQTLTMLGRLPFPRHLRAVPEIAGSHHETMDGTGYPRRLRREDMRVEARMLAIADIFEALTAEDRPYKVGKKLSEAITIMTDMKRRHHIDPDLFDLFLQAGIHRQYAERFMRPERIDTVDVAACLGPVAPPARSN